jgi:hypothetical protein
MLGASFIMLGRTFGREELVQIDGPSQKIGGTINDLLINVDTEGEVVVLVLANVGGVSLFQEWGTSNTKLDKLIKSVVLPVPSNRIACGENTIFFGTSSSTLPFLVLKP